MCHQLGGLFTVPLQQRSDVVHAAIIGVLRRAPWPYGQEHDEDNKQRHLSSF